MSHQGRQCHSPTAIRHVLKVDRYTGLWTRTRPSCNVTRTPSIRRKSNTAHSSNLQNSSPGRAGTFALSGMIQSCFCTKYGAISSDRKNGRRSTTTSGFPRQSSPGKPMGSPRHLPLAGFVDGGCSDRPSPRLRILAPPSTEAVHRSSCRTNPTPGPCGHRGREVPDAACAARTRQEGCA